MNSNADGNVRDTVGCNGDYYNANGANRDLWRRFNGYIDQSAVWDRQLQQADVDALYNGGLGLPYSLW